MIRERAEVSAASRGPAVSLRLPAHPGRPGLREQALCPFQRGDAWCYPGQRAQRGVCRSADGPLSEKQPLKAGQRAGGEAGEEGVISRQCPLRSHLHAGQRMRVSGAGPECSGVRALMQRTLKSDHQERTRYLNFNTVKIKPRASLVAQR